MKKTILSLFVALMATVAVQAQQISVVAEDGTTTSLYHTLQEAIEGASPNSVIYLPGGGFSISKTEKKKKKLTIIGIGYNAKNGNVDGITTLSGDLFFDEGSDGSAVMGCYITGTVIIGDAAEGKAPVNKVMVKYCNVGAVSVGKSATKGTIIAQNFIRGNTETNFGNSEVTISNNIITCTIWSVGGGKICNNIFAYGYGTKSSSIINLYYVRNTTITGNIFKSLAGHNGSNCTTSNNLVVGGSAWGDEPIDISVTAEELFADYSNWSVSTNAWNVNTNSDFHFNEAYKDYENKVGVYAGTGFSKKGMAPVPYIVAKQVAEQTDASGNLNIKIRVSAGE